VTDTDRTKTVTLRVTPAELVALRKRALTYRGDESVPQDNLFFQGNERGGLISDYRIADRLYFSPELDPVFVPHPGDIVRLKNSNADYFQRMTVIAPHPHTDVARTIVLDCNGDVDHYSNDTLELVERP